MADLPRRVPLDDAAAEEGVSRTTIYRLIRLGLLKKYRSPGVDRRTYIDVDALRQVRANPPLREVD